LRKAAIAAAQPPIPPPAITISAIFSLAALLLLKLPVTNGALKEGVATIAPLLTVNDLIKFLLFTINEKQL
jgi:hypothetical protein